LKRQNLVLLTLRQDIYKRGVPPRGLEFLKAVCENVNIPVYAIGGINIDGSRRQEVQECGAKGSCIMSGMMKA